jgi:acetoacetyl-CoA reductase
MARVAVVTGGTRGIGRSISEALHKAGYKVAANYAGNDEAAKKCSEETGIRCFRFDVSNYDSCAAGVKAIERDLGSVDILVNNAGITRDAVLHRMTPQQWGEVIATNLTSCFNMCRLVIEGMRERGFGRIVNIGSINGQAGQYGQVNYAAAKSGIHGFTKALAQEGAGKGVTVNAIAPGYIDTDMVRAVPPNVLEKIVARIPVGRLGHAEEIARGVLFLVSDEGGFITGSTLSINGGQHLYYARPRPRVRSPLLRGRFLHREALGEAVIPGGEAAVALAPDFVRIAEVEPPEGAGDRDLTD